MPTNTESSAISELRKEIGDALEGSPLESGATSVFRLRELLYKLMGMKLIVFPFAIGDTVTLIPELKGKKIYSGDCYTVEAIRLSNEGNHLQIRDASGALFFCSADDFVICEKRKTAHTQSAP